MSRVELIEAYRIITEKALYIGRGSLNQHREGPPRDKHVNYLRNGMEQRLFSAKVVNLWTGLDETVDLLSQVEKFHGF